MRRKQSWFSQTQDNWLCFKSIYSLKDLHIQIKNIWFQPRNLQIKIILYWIWSLYLNRKVIWCQETILCKSYCLQKHVFKIKIIISCIKQWTPHFTKANCMINKLFKIGLIKTKIWCWLIIRCSRPKSIFHRKIQLGKIRKWRRNCIPTKPKFSKMKNKKTWKLSSKIEKMDVKLKMPNKTKVRPHLPIL